MRNGGGRTEPRRANPQGLTETLVTSRAVKKGRPEREEATETGSRRGAAGANRDLGIRSRTKIHRAQGWEVEAGRSGRLPRWTGGLRSEEGGESGAKIGEAQSKGSGWGGSWYTVGERDDPENI